MSVPGSGEPSAGGASGTRVRASLAVLSVAVFISITTEILPIGLLPVISDDLGVSESRVGLLVSTYAVAVAVGSVPLVALLVRWPRRHVLAGLLATYALSSAVVAVGGSYSVVLVARLVAGVAHAGFFSVVFAEAVDLVPPERSGRALARLGAGNALALALGVPLGTALGTAVGWRWAFAVVALSSAVLAVLCLWVLPRRSSPASSAAQGVLGAVRARPLRRVALLVVTIALGHYCAYTYVGPLLQHAGVLVDAISMVLLGYGVAAVLGLGGAGIVADTHPVRGLRLAVGLLVTALVVVALAGGSGVVTMLAVVLWGIGFGALPTLLQTTAHRAAEDAPDAAQAVVNATFNVGISGGALLGGRELALGSPPLVAWTGAALGLLALVVLSHAPGRSP